MASDANFGLTDEHVVYELAAVLHFYLLDILGYGVYTSVYFVSLYLTLSRGCERPRIGPAVLITAIWVLVTIHASITWVRLDMIYIRHGGSRESQLASLFLSRSGDFVPLRATDTVVTFISLVLADIAMIWRCWVLYCRRWLVVIIPGLSLVAGSVCFIWRARIIMDFAFALNREIDKLSSLELIFLSTTVITNIFCTIAIIYRIVAVSGWRKSLKTYWRLIEILIESSLLYTAVYVIRIGLQIHTQSFTEGLDERVLFPRALRELPQRWLSLVWRRASQDLTIVGRVHPFRIWGRPRGLWLRVCILLDRASALSWTRISLPLSGALGRRGSMKVSDRRKTVVVLLNQSQTKRRHRFLYKSSSPRLLRLSVFQL